VRVFLDTNVLVAAFATRGLCADVLRVVLAEHDWVTGEVVLAGLRAVLERRLELPIRTVADILAFLRAHEVVARPDEPSDAPVRDPDDRWVLASAIAGHVDVLVTGDQGLLAVAETAPVPILNRRGFWNRLRS
jgi:putative PIN family toxin of toxin-antitoxin system